MLSIACGLLIGTEREFRQKPAGIRTCALVCLGSSLFTILSHSVEASPGTDQTRIASNIVQGIGFLGAGAILRYHDQIIGLTTAAVIWVSAAIGMAIGFQKFNLAITATLLTLATVTVLGFVEEKLGALLRRPKTPAAGPS